MATRKILNNFVVLGTMKFILGMEIPWGSGDQWHKYVTVVTLLPWQQERS